MKKNLLVMASLYCLTLSIHAQTLFIPNGTSGIGTSSTGNVLIGKNDQINADYKLDVAGKIRADEITVNSTGADFVFDASYKLRSLFEVEKFIRTYKHLPDIASAAKMQKEGLSVNEMQIKLLQKVEELTLYVIDLKKENEEQTKQNIELKKEIEVLKKSLK